MRYYIIAGEASGDLHGSNLIRGLLRRDPEAEIRFWGGDLMAHECGQDPVRHYKDGAIMGFWEVVKKMRKLLDNIKFCKKDILEWKPDAVIFIDYPGFNLRMAKFCHKKGFKTLYYIAPKVWGWKEGRIKSIKRYIDRLFIIFPFEVEYFKSKNVPATYVGNPLIDSINGHFSATETKEDFCRRYNIDPDKKIIAMLAGSRKNEIDTMMPVLLQFMDIFKKKGLDKHYTFIIAGAPSRERNDYEKHIDNFWFYPRIIFGETYSILKHADAAVINSGTASLEAAIIGTPQVVGYIAGNISYAIAKRLVRLKYISLGNLILDKGAFKEFIQEDCNAENLYDEITRLLDDYKYRTQMLDDYDEIRRMLGGPGASERVAAEIVDFVRSC